MDHELGERRNPDLVFTHLEMEYKSQHSDSKSLSHPNTVHYVHSAAIVRLIRYKNILLPYVKARLSLRELMSATRKKLDAIR